MISAKEARNATIRCREKLLENEIQYVENAINKAINDGKFAIELPTYLLTNTVEELKRLNYSISRKFRTINFADSIGYTKISWE